jgi:hypothetical protein
MRPYLIKALAHCSHTVWPHLRTSGTLFCRSYLCMQIWQLSRPSSTSIVLLWTLLESRCFFKFSSISFLIKPPMEKWVRLKSLANILAWVLFPQPEDPTIAVTVPFFKLRLTFYNMFFLTPFYSESFSSLGF